MQNELIIVSEYCRKCHIEPSFIDLLQEGGLIEVMTEGGERYLTFTQLPDVEPANLSQSTSDICSSRSAS